MIINNVPPGNPNDAPAAFAIGGMAYLAGKSGGSDIGCEPHHAQALISLDPFGNPRSCSAARWRALIEVHFNYAETHGRAPADYRYVLQGAPRGLAINLPLSVNDECAPPLRPLCCGRGSARRRFPALAPGHGGPVAGGNRQQRMEFSLRAACLQTARRGGGGQRSYCAAGCMKRGLTHPLVDGGYGAPKCTAICGDH